MSEPDELDVYVAGAMIDPEFRAAWKRASRGKVKLLTPLPLQVRFRLWWHGRVDRCGGWLCQHDHFTAARCLWRLFGMWR